MASSTTQVTNARAITPSVVPQEIVLDYDANYTVTVTPNRVRKGSRICFKSPKGKVRVVFVSPFGDDTIVMRDSEDRTLSVGGLFHFRCFFTEPGEAETEGKTGGILDIQPHLP